MEAVIYLFKGPGGGNSLGRYGGIFPPPPPRPHGWEIGQQRVDSKDKVNWEIVNPPSSFKDRVVHFLCLVMAIILIFGSGMYRQQRTQRERWAVKSELSRARWIEEHPEPKTVKLPTSMEGQLQKRLRYDGDMDKIDNFRVGDSGYFSYNLISLDKTLGIWLKKGHSRLSGNKQGFAKYGLGFSYVFITKKDDGFHIEIYPNINGKHEKRTAKPFSADCIRGWELYIPASSVVIKNMKDREKDRNEYKRT